MRTYTARAGDAVLSFDRTRIIAFWRVSLPLRWPHFEWQVALSPLRCSMLGIKVFDTPEMVMLRRGTVVLDYDTEALRVWVFHGDIEAVLLENPAFAATGEIEA